MSTTSRNCTWKTVGTCLCNNWNVHHSDDELKLRHLQLLVRLGLLELELREQGRPPTASRLSRLPRNPLLGLQGAALDGCNVDLASSLMYWCSPRRPGSPSRRQSTRRTESAAPADTGLDAGSACPYRALWTLRTSLTPGVCTQDREIRTEAAAKRWRGRVT